MCRTQNLVISHKYAFIFFTYFGLYTLKFVTTNKTYFLNCLKSKIEREAYYFHVFEIKVVKFYC